MVKAEPHNFKKALRALMTERPAGEHPSLEDLIAFREQRLPASKEAQLEAHLGRCRRCTNLLLELAEFNQPAAPPPGEEPDFEALVFARALTTETRHRPLGVHRVLLAAALVATIAMGVWAMSQQREATSLRQTVADLSRPEFATPLYDLYPGAVLRGDAELETLELPPEKFSLTLILNLPNAQPLEALVIRDAADREVWRASGDSIAPVGNALVLTLHRDFLTPGEYQLVFLTPGDRLRAPLASYPLLVH